MRNPGDSNGLVRIAVDAMGGDYAPSEIVQGSVRAVRELDVEILLVGQGAKIGAEIEAAGVANMPIRLVEASEVIVEGEKATLAVMRKPNSSVSLAVRLVKEGEADAVVSAGSTGACVVSAFQHLGVLPGMERPTVGGNFLRLAPDILMFDLGANVGCQPQHLLSFAVAGSAYAKTFLGIDEPTVGLLNVGTEEGKGDLLAKETYALLKESGLNFVGNVEGSDIIKGRATVIVCDGFVGNILVKYSESLGFALGEWLRRELEGSVPEAKLDELAEELVKLIGPGEVQGGTLLWGIDGVFAVGHGNSRAPQVLATIEQAKRAVETGFIDTLRGELERVHKTISL